MVKIGIIGTSLNLMQKIESINLVDGLNISGILSTEGQFTHISALPILENYQQLLQEVDAIYFLETLFSPFEMIQEAFRYGKHVLIDQISLLELTEIEELLSSRKEANVTCAIASSELCHPAYLNLKNEVRKPLHIDSHRSIKYDNIDTNQNILKMILNDLTVIRNLIKSDIKKIYGNGIMVMGEQIDLAIARLEFSNGCIANMQINKFAAENENTLTIYERSKMINIDLINSKSKSLARSYNNKDQYINQEESTEGYDPFLLLMDNFRDSIMLNRAPIMKLREGYENLGIAQKILKKMNSFIEE